MARRWMVLLVVAAATLVAGCGLRRAEPAGPESVEPEDGPAADRAGGARRLAEDGPVAADLAGGALPAEVLANQTSAQVRLALRPVPEGRTDPGPGLRSVLLHRGSLRLEPHGEWPDGSPVSSDAGLDAGGMERLLAALAAAGFFETARRCASTRHVEPLSSRPAGACEYPPRWPGEPHLAVEVVVHDLDWHHYWVAPVDLAGAGGRLGLLAAALEGSALEQVRALEAEVARAAGAAAPGPPEGGPPAP